MPQRKLPVHARQLFPESVLGANAPDANTAGTTISDEGDVRVWTLDGEVLIASIHSKMHAISPDVAEALSAAVELAEAEYKGLVIWSPDEMFSVGADLQAMLPAFVVAGIGAVEGAEEELQNTMLKIRYASVPVISAVRGMALGGGCELAVYSAKRVAAMESYIGLVEVGVGLIPGAGGLTYIARRAAENASASTGTDLLPFLTEGFTAAAMAKVGTGALDSKKLGYLLDSDVIVPNKDELLYVALQQAKAMADAGYRAPLRRSFRVAGRSGAATIKGQLVNMRDGGFISAHDFHIASLIAGVVTGGDVGRGLARDRGIPDDAGTQGVLLAHRASEDAGADHGDAEHGQARAQLKPARTMSQDQGAAGPPSPRAGEGWGEGESASRSPHRRRIAALVSSA